jgi:hypothetical protein
MIISRDFQGISRYSPLIYARNMRRKVLTFAKKSDTRFLFSSMSDIFSVTDPIKPEILSGLEAIPTALRRTF